MKIPQSCLAAVLETANEPFSLRTVTVPALQHGQVLVRIRLCAVCGSDLHTFTGRRREALPTIPGHEAVGEIIDIAGAVNDCDGRPLQIGQRITWSIAVSCHHCDRCRRGLPQKCRSLQKFGHEEFADGRLSGGLAEYCVLPAGSSIVCVPDSISDRAACSANCATATAAAAVRCAGPLTDRNCVIFGAGMLGLTAGAMLQSASAGSVTIVDVSADRRARAVQFGIPAVGPGERPVGDSVDCVLEMSGHPEAVQAGLSLASIGATVVLVGSVSPSAPVSLDPESVVRRCLTICGVHNYTPNDLRTAVSFLEQYTGRYDFESLVETVWPLEGVDEAFACAERERPIRVAIAPRPLSGS